MMNFRVRATGGLGLGCVLAATAPMMAQGALPAAMASGIDVAAADVLKATGVPSASVAVVQGGRVGYVKGNGMARLDPGMGVGPGLRFWLGWISKRFRAGGFWRLGRAG